MIVPPWATRPTILRGATLSTLGPPGLGQVTGRCSSVAVDGTKAWREDPLARRHHERGRTGSAGRTLRFDRVASPLPNYPSPAPSLAFLGRGWWQALPHTFALVVAQCHISGAPARSTGAAA